MKIALSKYFLFIIFSLAFISCEDKAGETLPENPEASARQNEDTPRVPDYVNKPGQPAIDTNDPVQKKKFEQKLDSIRNKKDFGENLPYKELTPFLPGEISGFESFPISTTTIRGKGKQVTTIVKGQYKGSHRNSIIIDIQDYGIYGEIPFRPSYYDPINEKGFEIEKIENEFGVGYIKNDPDNNLSSLNFLINDRIVIVIRSDGNSSSRKLLMDIFENIDLQKLNQKIKNS